MIDLRFVRAAETTVSHFKMFLDILIKISYFVVQLYYCFRILI
jgi:hypothetical protein